LGQEKTRSRTLKAQYGSQGSAQSATRGDPERTNTMQEFSMNGAELEKVHVEIAKLMAETKKLNAEAGKMTRETFWYPVAVATGLIGTVATVTTLLIKFV
jgi:hypothetical protein